jgi:DNA-directed RNA polymerase specialized sigma24 family protein
MGETARRAQRGRADERDARLARARQRRLALDKDREARDARIDAAVADVYQAQDEREAAVRAIDACEVRTGEAIVRILAEGVPMAQVAELTELSINQVQRLKVAAAEAKQQTGPGAARDARPQSGAGRAVALGPARPEAAAS